MKVVNMFINLMPGLKWNFRIQAWKRMKRKRKPHKGKHYTKFEEESSVDDLVLFGGEFEVLEISMGPCKIMRDPTGIPPKKIAIGIGLN